MYNKTRGILFFSRLLWPLSFVYGAVLHIRHFLYDRGILPSAIPPVPTLCVGNLGLGGTGKTPMVEYLLSLAGPEIRVAVLSRGYGRTTRGFQLAGPRSTAAQIGDEPMQIFTNYPQIPLAVDANRRNGIEELRRRFSPELIVLDDAMQHRSIRPTETLLLTEYTNLYTEDRLLPAGRLRDVKSRASAAGTVVVTKCPKDLDPSDRERLRSRLRLRPDQVLICCVLDYDGTVANSSGRRSLDDFKGVRGALVTGIANPLPLKDYLGKQGVEYTHFRYPDHHPFTQNEVDSFRELPWQLSTQKDYMRLSDRNLPRLYYIPVRHRALWDGEEKLKDLLRNTVRG